MQRSTRREMGAARASQGECEIYRTHTRGSQTDRGAHVRERNPPRLYGTPVKKKEPRSGLVFDSRSQALFRTVRESASQLSPTLLQPKPRSRRPGSSPLQGKSIVVAVGASGNARKASETGPRYSIRATRRDSISIQSNRPPSCKQHRETEAASFSLHPLDMCCSLNEAQRRASGTREGRQRARVNSSGYVSETRVKVTVFLRIFQQR